jgi:lipopolysaccharide transport system permease protein
MPLEVRIRPKSNLALIDFRELWRYRDLLSMFVWRDFAVKYKQTLLGPVWFLLQPLLPTVVFTLIFGKLAGMPTDGLPPFLFFLCNQIVWGYFSANYTSTSTCLLSNLNLFTKVYLPRLVVPLASLVSNAIAIGIQLILFVIMWCWFKFATPAGAVLHLTPSLLFFPLLFLLAAAQGLGFGLWMASFTAKYRDLQQLSGVLIQLWMYGSAVVFPLSKVPEKYQALVSANPVTFLTESFRYCLLGVGTVSWEAGVYSVVATVVVLLGGLYRFNKTARTFVDIA